MQGPRNFGNCENLPVVRPSGLGPDDAFKQTVLDRNKGLGENSAALRDCESVPGGLGSAIFGEECSKLAFYTAFMQPLDSILQAEGLNTEGYLNSSGPTQTPTPSGPIPDFQWRPEGTPVGMSSRPGALSDLNITSGLGACRLSRDVFHSVNHVFTCMDSCHSWTGFITGHDLTVFVRRTPEKPMKLLVSEAFAPDAQGPTLLQAFYHLVHMERELQQEYGQPPRSSKPRRVPQRVEPDERERNIVLHASERGQPRSLLHDLPAISSLDNAACVVKAVDPEKDDIEPLFTEAIFLDKLHNLKCVVNLLSLGRLWDGHHVYLATEYVEGRHIQADGSEPEAVKRAGGAGGHSCSLCPAWGLAGAQHPGDQAGESGLY